MVAHHEVVGDGVPDVGDDDALADQEGAHEQAEGRALPRQQRLAAARHHQARQHTLAVLRAPHRLLSASNSPHAPQGAEATGCPGSLAPLPSQENSERVVIATMCRSTRGLKVPARAGLQQQAHARAQWRVSAITLERVCRRAHLQMHIVPATAYSEQCTTSSATVANIEPHLERHGNAAARGVPAGAGAVQQRLPVVLVREHQVLAQRRIRQRARSLARLPLELAPIHDHHLQW